MSICIARLRKTVTPLMRSCLQFPAKRCVFKSSLKRSDSTAGSRNESGSEFQTVGRATEKARVDKSAVTKLRNIQFATAGRTETMSAWKLHSLAQQSAKYRGGRCRRHRWTVSASLYVYCTQVHGNGTLCRKTFLMRLQ